MSQLNPVVIIGAPRSGTNMLRDVLTSLERIATWPCDEINAIWRHGNASEETDILTPDLATSSVRSYIRNRFSSIQDRLGASMLVEKTCANCLRVPFVAKVLPEAKFIYIYRDGVDAAVSASLRWRAKLDIAYTLKKARYVPLSDLPFYGQRFLSNQLHQLISTEKRLKYWGPVVPKLDELLKTHPLEETCMLQWKSCVDMAEDGFRSLSSDRIFRIRYESFVDSPTAEMRKITEFLQVDDANLAEATKSVTNAQVGKGRRSLQPDSLARLLLLGQESLKRYGYLGH